MTNEQIMDGIWAATNHQELTAHMDKVDEAIEAEECSYDMEFCLAMQDSILEIMRNNYQRVLH